MTYNRQRSPLELGGIVTANVVKLVAVGIAVHELTGDARAEVLAGVAFILTVAQSIESSVIRYFSEDK